MARPLIIALLALTSAGSVAWWLASQPEPEPEPQPKPSTQQPSVPAAPTKRQAIWRGSLGLLVPLPTLEPVDADKMQSPDEHLRAAGYGSLIVARFDVFRRPDGREKQGHLIVKYLWDMATGYSVHTDFNMYLNAERLGTAANPFPTWKQHRFGYGTRQVLTTMKYFSVDNGWLELNANEPHAAGWIRAADIASHLQAVSWTEFINQRQHQLWLTNSPREKELRPLWIASPLYESPDFTSAKVPADRGELPLVAVRALSQIPGWIEVQAEARQEQVAHNSRTYIRKGTDQWTGWVPVLSPSGDQTLLDIWH